MALSNSSIRYFGTSRITNTDRKSTRLNSSHGYISYAVFCLKKKKKRYNLPFAEVLNQKYSTEKNFDVLIAEVFLQYSCLSVEPCIHINSLYTIHYCIILHYV